MSYTGLNREPSPAAPAQTLAAVEAVRRVFAALQPISATIHKAGRLGRLAQEISNVRR